jgi:hypothetical protein
MISVAACAGDASATVTATNCKNLKANFTGEYPALPRRRNICPLRPHKSLRLRFQSARLSPQRTTQFQIAAGL